MHLASIPKRDEAENSIMQTITIAVSAILIAAGLVTAPGLINNARDNNARTDLANIAYAQEFYLSTTGHYYDVDNTNTFLTIEQEMTAKSIDKESAVNNLQYEAQNIGVNGLGTSVNVAADDVAGVSFTLSGDVTGHAVETCEGVPYYLLKDQSASGKWFYRGSGSAETSSDFSKISSGIPAKVLVACPGFGDGFGEAPSDDENPTDPGNNISGGQALPLNVGSTKYDDDIYFGISGYSDDPDVSDFGGGSFWSPEPGSQISLSYYDSATDSLIEFLDHAFSSTEWEDAYVQYDGYSNMLFGKYEGEYVTPSNDADFQKMHDNGGSMTFTSSETGAEITVQWSAPNAEYMDRDPAFPQPPVYLEHWSQLTQAQMQTFDISGDGMTVMTVYSSSTCGVELPADNDECGYIWLSHDGGETFNAIKDLNGVAANYYPVGGQVSGAKLWIKTFQSNNVRYYTSIDSGNSWQLADVPTNIGMGNTPEFAVSPDGTRIMVGSGTTIRVSTGSSTYNEATISGAVTRLVWGADGTLYATSNSGGWRSTNNGVSWSALSGVPTTANGVAVNGDGSVVVVSAAAQGIYLSTDHGETFTRVNEDGWNMRSVAISADGQKIISGGNSAVLVSTDQGATWKRQEALGGTDWTRVQVADDFSRIYAAKTYSYSFSDSGLYVHLEGDEECVDYCD